MFCTKCGKQITDGAKFCPFCGSAQNTGSAWQEDGAPDRYAAGTSQNASHIRNAQASGTMNANAPGYTPERSLHPMKWFKFLIYVQLFLYAIANVITAVTYFTGGVYSSSGISAKLMYVRYSGLRAVDYLYAICLIGLAGVAISIRMKLAKYKKDGPTMYISLMIASLCVALVYAVLVGIITKTWSALPTTIGLVIGEAIYVALMKVYFSKRTDLFVN